MMHLLFTFWDLMKISAFWLIFSFILCGILHVFLKPERLQKSLGNKKLSSLLKATLSGMLLPMCSCGVVPLALSLYHSGAYLGPTLAFLVATPIINPAALLLAYALLGPSLATIYLISGFLIPLTVGLLGNRFGGKESISPYASKTLFTFSAPVAPQPVEKPPLSTQLLSGFKWGFHQLGIQVSRFVVLGIVLAAILLEIVPSDWIQSYLSRPDMVSLLGITLLGAIMYVCAVGHIPFIAALLATGASPGVAITFLLAGVATNLPEMMSIWKLIGKRAVCIYTGTVVILGVFAGYVTNLLLMKDFMPLFDLSRSQGQIKLANVISFAAPDWLEALCAVILLLMGVYAWYIYAAQKIKLRKARPCTNA